VLKDNCFLASRFGIDARVAVNEAGDQSTLRELAESTLSQCRPYAERTGDSAFLDHLARSVASGLPYERCRRVFESSGSFESVVAASAEELSRDLELSSKTASQ
jgi:carboxylate-amine ligase